jgi:hypothetical protein
MSCIFCLGITNRWSFHIDVYYAFHLVVYIGIYEFTFFLNTIESNNNFYWNPDHFKIETKL